MSNSQHSQETQQASRLRSTYMHNYKLYFYSQFVLKFYLFYAFKDTFCDGIHKFHQAARQIQGTKKLKNAWQFLRRAF